jgi:hypothetical protein
MQFLGKYSKLSAESPGAFSFDGWEPHENAFEMKNLKFQKNSFNSATCDPK